MGVRVDVYENPRNPANTAVVEYLTADSWYVNDEYATLQVHAGNDVIAEYPAGTWARVEAIPAPEVAPSRLVQLLDTAYGLITNVDGGTDSWMDSVNSTQMTRWYNLARIFMGDYRESTNYLSNYLSDGNWRIMGYGIKYDGDKVSTVMSNLRDAVPADHTVSKVRDIGVHEGEAIDDIRNFEAEHQARVRQLTSNAISLRELRERRQKEMEELVNEIDDINAAIRSFRLAAGVEDQDEWYGYDTPFEDESVRG